MTRRLGAIALCAITLLAGCTTLRPLQDTSAASIREHVEVGDRVQVRTTSGRAYEFEVTRVTPDALHGVGGGKRLRIPFAVIESLQVRRTSGWKTAGGVVAFVAIVAALTAILVGEAFEDFSEGLAGLFGS